MVADDAYNAQLARIEEKVDNVLDAVSELKNDMRESREHRNNFSEIRDHALWTAIECRNHKVITQKILNAKDEQGLLNLLATIKF